MTKLGETYSCGLSAGRGVRGLGCPARLYRVVIILLGLFLAAGPARGSTARAGWRALDLLVAHIPDVPGAIGFG
jgi:hypothetical protein